MAVSLDSEKPDGGEKYESPAKKMTAKIERAELETFSLKPANYRLKFKNKEERLAAKKRAWENSRIAMVCESGTTKPMNWKRATPEDIGAASQSVGLQLYFAFVKKSAYAILFWALLLSPLLALCAMDSGDSDDKVGAGGLALFSLASFGDSTELDSAATKGVKDRTIEINGEVEKMMDWTPTLSLMGAFGAFAYFLFVLHFKYVKLPKAVEAYDSGTISPADFTFEVTSLPDFDIVPPLEYEKKLKDHFARVLAAARTEAREVARKKLKMDASVVEEAEKKDHIDVEEIFPEVSLVRDYGGKLAERLAENKLRQDIVEASLDEDEVKISKARTEAQKFVEKKRKRAGKKAKASLAEGEKLAVVDSTPEIERPIFRAFVTCKLVLDKDMIVEWYRMSRTSLGFLFQTKANRFEGKRIVVDTAPEPSNILWENQDCPTRERFFRKSITKLIVFILLCITMAGIMLSKNYQTEQTEKAQGKDCREPYELINNGSGDVELTKATGLIYVAANPAKDVLTDCQCSQLGLSTLLANDKLKKACETYTDKLVMLNIVTIGSALAVVVINVLLKTFLVGLASFERPLTVSGLECAVSLKVFIAQFLNTTLIVYALNLKFLSDIGFKGKYDDFSHAWYATVGLAVTSAMMINVASPHFIGVALSFVDRLKRNCITWFSCCATTEEEVYTAYEPPEFELAPRCGAVLNTVFSSLMFAAGCPMLVWFMFFNHFFTYLCDKYVLLAVSKRPPAFDALVIRDMISVIPTAILFHAVFGVWMLGNTNVFPSEPFIDIDIGTPPTILAPLMLIFNRGLLWGGLPYFLLTLATAAYFGLETLKLILGPGFSVVIQSVTSCCCGGSSRTDGSLHRLSLGLPEEAGDELDDEHKTNWNKAKKDWISSKIAAGYRMRDSLNEKYSSMAAAELDLEAFADDGELRKVAGAGAGSAPATAVKSLGLGSLSPAVGSLPDENSIPVDAGTERNRAVIELEEKTEASP